MPRISPLAKVLAYILGRCPDEFGLVPSADGFVPVKALLQALAEEDGWRHVRRGHLNELIMLGAEAPVEMVDQRIRAVERRHLPALTAAANPPKLLFAAIRRRAYDHVRQEGIADLEPPGLVLAAEPSMALRMGRRRDPDPVLLEVRSRDLMAAGAALWSFGQGLFVASALPPGCFSGPPPPKTAPPLPSPTPVRPAPHPGSFFLDPEPSAPPAPKERHREPDWKRQRRLDRRQQRKERANR